ncbi:alpha/beta fold hydrolase, partial [Saccharomonospora halophila]|uniref:alpha/beta fold hydrolase n=1 Tax=Saccharomonospora halophila TaxID=129922 RepID=UPI0038CDC428
MRTRLRGRFRVVTYDVRGAGESDAPREVAAYRLDTLAADLLAVLDGVAGDRPVHLLAHDWGSIQAWHAVTGPWLRGRVASFTSISGPDLDHAAHWFRAQPAAAPAQARRRTAATGPVRIPGVLPAPGAAGTALALRSRRADRACAGTRRARAPALRRGARAEPLPGQPRRQAPAPRAPPGGDPRPGARPRRRPVRGRAVADRDRPVGARSAGAPDPRQPLGRARRSGPDRHRHRGTGRRGRARRGRFGCGVRAGARYGRR